MDRDFELPANTRRLLHWLETAPNFHTVEREQTLFHGRRRGFPGSDRSYSDDTVGTKTVTESVWVHPDYEIDTRACHDSQADVCEAWEEMKFPIHNLSSTQGLDGAQHYCWSSSGNAPISGAMPVRGRNRDPEKTINYQAIQHPDGRGVIEHYSTIAAIRTRNGLVLTNEQDFGGGFATVTWPDSETTLPLTGIDDVLTEHPETLYDITSVDGDRMGLHRTENEYRRVNLSTGAAVVLIYDSTANNRAERKCGFYLDPEEAELYEGEEGAQNALQPIDVKQAQERGLEIVQADEFAGSGAHGFYDDNLLGEAIIRQGEWYLVPMDEDFDPEAPVRKCLPTTGSNWQYGNVEVPDDVGHTAFDAVVEEFPKRCPVCEDDDARLDVRSRTPALTCAGCEAKVVYDHETYEEIVNESILHWVEDTYGDLYSEALDHLDSHRPRDLAVTRDGVYVRGSFRHVDNEHKMLNLKDRWHLAAENTRDVTVFDLARDDVGGVARYE